MHQSHQELKSRLAKELEEAGLPPATELLDRVFTFTTDYDNSVLVGRITGVMRADETGLCLFVTTSYRGATPIQRLAYEPTHGWALRHPDPEWARPKPITDDEAFDAGVADAHLTDEEEETRVDGFIERLIRARFTYGTLELAD